MKSELLVESNKEKSEEWLLIAPDNHIRCVWNPNTPDLIHPIR